MQVIQDLVHRLEVGGGMRYLRIGLAVLAAVGVTVFYNLGSFRNFSTREAMDTAQLGRNIAEGKGYTTLFVRPFSMHLLRQHNQTAPGALNTSKPLDPSQIKDRHPDLANAPAYPLLLAGVLKVMPFDYSVPLNRPFWSDQGEFFRYRPEFWISMFNQALFFALITMMFFLVRRLFEPRVAWLSAVLLFGAEHFWRLSVSGLSTIFLLCIFTGLAWCLVLIEQGAREGSRGNRRLILLAILVGALVGLGALTRYSFGWLILPVVLFLVLFGGPPRVSLGITALVVFACAFAPWLVRNYHVSGTPFGTAGYAIYGQIMPGDSLQRSLEPELIKQFARSFTLKLIFNTRQILTNELPKLGGSWISAFFIVGLLIPFRDPGPRRLRYFILACVAILIPVQALGRTELYEFSPELNSEDMLVLVAPFALAYGISFFYVVLDQMEFAIRELRFLVIGAVSAAACLPMIFSFLPPKGTPVVPPYNARHIQAITGWVRENELAMSDIPWAVAWYAKRQCVSLPTAGPADFVEINDYQKPIQVLYVTRSVSDPAWATVVLQLGFGAYEGEDSKTAVRRYSIPIRLSNGTRASFPLHNLQPETISPKLFLLTADASPRKE